MAYDSSRGITVLFGGVIFGDTWQLETSCPPPSLRAHPQPLAACPSSDVTFSVTAAGTGPLAYQWQIQDTTAPGGWLDLTDGPLIRNAQHIADVLDSQTATLRYTLFAAGGLPIRSRCRVTNDCGSIVISNAATLTICLADFNCDAFVNSQDFFDFLAAFFALIPSADINHDTFINSQDFFDFLAAFFAGC